MENQDTTACRYVVRISDFVLVAVGGEWSRFARENGVTCIDPGSVVGRWLFDFVHGANVCQFYRDLCEGVHRRATSVEFAFRCDSPNRKRFMRMRISRLNDSLLQFTSWVGHEEDAKNPPLPVYTPADFDDAGVALTSICSMCKKIECEAGEWIDIDVAAASIDFMSGGGPRLSHGLCPICFAEAMAALDSESC